MSGIGITAICSLLVFFAAGAVSSQQSIVVGNMQMDQVRWGSRLLHVPVENLRDTTAHIEVTLHTVYPGHYLSGLDRLEVDTTFDVPANESLDIDVSFEIPGSFGRMATRAMVVWRYDDYEPPPEVNDTVLQVFSNVFKAKGDATEYAGRKHGVGPVYSTIDHFPLNFEYPRLVLFLLARGESPESISELFKAQADYTDLIIARFGDEGFFPRADRVLAPGVLAISEREGYPLKEKADAAVGAFASWYENTGKDALFSIMDDCEIDPYTRELPSLQIPILLALFEASWADTEAGFEPLRFEDMTRDIEMHNRTRWIVQGGEFFLPKLCLGVFEQNGQMYLATFSPDPKLPFDKASIYNMRKAVEEAGEAIVVIERERIRDILAAVRDKGVIADFESAFRPIVDEARAGLEYCEDYQAPYLADYLFRLAVGKYFVDHRPSQGLDCVRILF